MVIVLVVGDNAIMIWELGGDRRLGEDLWENLSKHKRKPKFYHLDLRLYILNHFLISFSVYRSRHALNNILIMYEFFIYYLIHWWHWILALLEVNKISKINCYNYYFGCLEILIFTSTLLDDLIVELFYVYIHYYFISKFDGFKYYKWWFPLVWCSPIKYYNIYLHDSIHSLLLSFFF